MISAEIETSRDAEGSITNPVEESEGGGDIQGDGDRTLGDADSSCCEDIEPRAVEVYLSIVSFSIWKVVSKIQDVAMMREILLS